jgi:hypothetical protein
VARGLAEAGSEGWYLAQIWLGMMAQFSGDLTGALGHFTAVRDAAVLVARAELTAAAGPLAAL